MDDLLHTRPAFITLRYYNKHMLIGQEEDDLINGIEDHADPDGRMYRLEYISTLDGKHANAYCRSNPWNRKQPHDGTSDYISHVYPNGFLCIGSGVTRDTRTSPHKLEDVIKRARFWSAAFSCYKETGDKSVFEV